MQSIYSKTNFRMKNLAYIGPISGNSLSRFNELKKYFDHYQHYSYHHLYNSVKGKVVNKISRRTFWEICSASLSRQITDNNFDLAWVEMGREIKPSLIRKLKNQSECLVNTYSDRFLDRKSKKFSSLYNASIKYFDVIFTPRQSDFNSYLEMGANRVEKFWKGYDDKVISSYKQEVLATDLIFLGHREEERADYLHQLVRAIRDKYSFEIYGNGWSGFFAIPTYPSIPYAEYSKAYMNAKIGLNFFSKWANDSQNSRLFEIPGSKTFLLSEYSEDAAQCFKEGEEAEFFRSPDELVDKVSYYLKNDSKREKIALNGFEKAKNNFTNRHRVTKMLELIGM